MYTQHELKDIADWAIEHLDVDFYGEDNWTVMTLGNERVMRALVDSVTNEVDEYLLCATDTSNKVVKLYNEWKEYE